MTPIRRAFGVFRSDSNWPGSAPPGGPDQSGPGAPGRPVHTTASVEVARVALPTAAAYARYRSQTATEAAGRSWNVLYLSRNALTPSQYVAARRPSAVLHSWRIVAALTGARNTPE